MLAAMRLRTVYTLLISFGLCILFYYTLIISLSNKPINANSFRTPLIKPALHPSQPHVQQISISSSYKCTLSYSLFGKGSWQRYGSNIGKVSQEASMLYKNWTVRLYHDGLSLTQDIMSNLSAKHPNLEFHNVKATALGDLSHKNGMTWRFLPIADRNIDVTCVRDLDSVINKREIAAVQAWIKSGKLFHIMRDNIMHGIEILGGMWCFRNIKNRDLGDSIINKCIDVCGNRKFVDNKIEEVRKQDDQSFLSRYVWPLIKEDVLAHDAYSCKHFNGVPFPTKRETNPIEFVARLREQPCNSIEKCPFECRPINHRDWEYC